MTIDKLRDLLRTQPFVPFRIRLADGRNVDVPHPDSVSLDPRGRVAHVFRSDGRSEFIDMMLVASLELRNGHATRRRRRKG